MTTRTWTKLLALVALTAAPAGAQQMRGMHRADQQAGMMGQGMMQMCPGMTAGEGMAGHLMGGQGMHGQQGMMGSGMAGMMGAGVAGPGALLGAAEELALTPDQTSRLETLAEEAREVRQEHMQAAMAAHASGAEALSADTPDLQAYEQALEEAATHMVQAHVAAAQAALDARAVLTPEQQSKLQDGMRLMSGMRCGAMGGMMGDGSMMRR